VGVGGGGWVGWVGGSNDFDFIMWPTKLHRNANPPELLPLPLVALAALVPLGRRLTVDCNELSHPDRS
jgi:hypothetical protein